VDLQEHVPAWSTIRVGAKFDWREAARTKLTMPSPTTMDYAVGWVPRGQIKSVSRLYTANITHIRSPVAFEGCAIDLVLDVLTGQPPRYQTKISAESLVLVNSSP
jgi:hypothetical protein